MSPNPPQTERTADGYIVLDTPVTLPDVLDLLVVGGGPVGTACAFRAKELGMAALVVEMDDLMMRIRDYEKGHLIYPDFGGGDTMQFPEGGELTAALRFEPTDKDLLVEQWRALYRRFSVPARVGVELLSVRRGDDGVWSAEVRHRPAKQNDTIRARNVVLGLGRGVPRRLDIAGNVHDLAYALTDAAGYVGEPACVIGGGTAAAEAAIAISKAKVASTTDRSPVYWCYRGRSMPTVSNALEPELFDVITQNGNLKFLPESEPVGINTRGGKEYLAVRTQVSELPHLPREIVQLEFAKTFCVACIGADRPDALLKKFGSEFVPMETGKGDRVVVSPSLETRVPSLFLAGDLLSHDYAETTDFDAHPSLFVIKPRRGNIKAALRDGVLVANVAKDRLDGKVILVPAAPAPRPPVGPPNPGRLVALLAGDMPADEFRLNANGVTTIGRLGATVSFASDSMLSDLHAEISHGPAGLQLRDLGSANGVFIKVRQGREVPLASGMIIKAGRQWLVAQGSGGRWEVIHYDSTGHEVQRHVIAEGTTLTLGRAAPSTILDGTDGTLGRRHLSLSLEGSQLQLRDLGSRNGTFLKVVQPWQLADGDLIWMGNQLLRVMVGDAGPVMPPSPPPRAPAGQGGAPPAPTGPSTPPPEPAVAASSGGEPSVTFVGRRGGTFPFGTSSSLLDLALANRIRIKNQCLNGDCGLCRVTITSGADQLGPRSEKEDKTLRMNGHPEPESRLACVVKAVNGPVVVQVPQ